MIARHAHHAEDCPSPAPPALPASPALPTLPTLPARSPIFATLAAVALACAMFAALALVPLPGIAGTAHAREITVVELDKKDARALDAYGNEPGNYTFGGYRYRTPRVYVRGCTKGKIAYNKRTHTLMLRNVKADEIELGEYFNVKIVLKGNNRLTNGISTAPEGGTRLTIDGPGSLTIKGDSLGIAFAWHSYGWLFSGGMSKASRLTMAGGSVRLIGCPLSITGGDFIMTGGSLSVTAPKWHDAISLNSQVSKADGKTVCGGRIVVRGGKLSAKVRSKNHDAIEADSMRNKSDCLKAVKGRLPQGASFFAGGNEYQVCQLEGSSSKSAKLVAYRSEATNPTLDNVKFGEFSYALESIAPEAFRTTCGKRVESLTVKNSLQEIEMNTFTDMDALKALTFAKWPELVKSGAFTGTEQLESLTFFHDMRDVEPGAFAGCGKDGGRGLTVYWHDRPGYRANSDLSSERREALIGYGLPPEARVVWDRE